MQMAFPNVVATPSTPLHCVLSKEILKRITARRVDLEVEDSLLIPRRPSQWLYLHLNSELDWSLRKLTANVAVIDQDNWERAGDRELTGHSDP